MGKAWHGLGATGLGGKAVCTCRPVQGGCGADLVGSLFSAVRTCNCALCFMESSSASPFKSF